MLSLLDVAWVNEVFVVCLLLLFILLDAIQCISMLIFFQQIFHITTLDLNSALTFSNICSLSPINNRTFNRHCFPLAEE